MNKFKNLTIFTKILSIILVAMIAFLTNILINVNAISNNQALLSDLELNIKHRVNLSVQNSNLLLRADETFTQSITLSDEDILESARGYLQKLTSNVKKLQQLSPDNKQYAQYLFALAEYEKISNELSLGIINETIEFAAVGDSVNRKKDLYKKLSSDFTNEKVKADSSFSELIKTAVDNSKNARDFSIAMGVFLLLLMCLIGYTVARSISKSVRSVAKSLKELAEGDGNLNNTIAVESTDEVGSVVNYFNIFTKMLLNIVQDVVGVVQPLTDSANQLNSDVSQVEVNVQQQKKLANITTESMHEMQSSVVDITESARLAAQAVNAGEVEVNQTMDKVKQSLIVSNELTHEITTASKVVSELAQNSQNMNQILDVIKGIADQTNLLALNAAIEAARAGEQGRGFAVVADEVRNLALRSATATTEIRSLLESLIHAATVSVSTMSEAQNKATLNEQISKQVGSSLAKIKEQIAHINSTNVQIANASKGQASVADNVVANITNMFNGFEETSDRIDQIREITLHLDANAVKIKQATSRFSI